ncbi:MAG: type II toxin-antitoxin system RelE/ParE family toxin [Proteobacteria bacterium]|nr:type II toxin-antitoxin system RelE/ParE family toxin [Pseudomonadota bacterium]
MKYRLVYTQRAVRDIGKLEVNVKKRIGKTLMRYQDAPLDYAESLTDSSLGSYRFRVGDYRIIFDIEGRDIVVLRVGHRRELYKR